MMNNQNPLKEILQKMFKTVLESNKFPKSLEQMYLSTTKNRNLTTTQKTILLVFFAAGLLTEILFITMILGLSVLLLINK